MVRVQELCTQMQLLISCPMLLKSGTPEGTRTPDLLLRRQLLYPAELLAHLIGAGDGNRTRVSSLEGWCSTIELHPHKHQLNDISIINWVCQAEILWNSLVFAGFSFGLVAVFGNPEGQNYPSNTSVYPLYTSK